MTNHENCKLHIARLVRHLPQFTNTHQKLIKTSESSAKARCITEVYFSRVDSAATARVGGVGGGYLDLFSVSWSTFARFAVELVKLSSLGADPSLPRSEICEKLLKMFKQFDSFCGLMRNWKFHNASLRLIHEQLPTRSIHENLLSHLLHEIGNANSQKSLFQPSEKKFLLFFLHNKKRSWIIICHFSLLPGRFRVAPGRRAWKVNQSWFWEDLRFWRRRSRFSSKKIFKCTYLIIRRSISSCLSCDAIL